MNAPPTRLRQNLLDRQQFERFRDLLAEYAGVFLDQAQHRLLETALAERLAATNLGLVEYQQKLSSQLGRAELQCLVELVLNHETYFFRNGAQLQVLGSSLLLQIHRHLPPGQPIRVWSAGCASGEEPYSLAIVALETLGNPPLRPIEIIATDLSEDVLRRARVGSYRGRALQNISPELLGRYFQPSAGSYSVVPALRSLVSFRRLNLLEPFPAELKGVDIIFCQNVTIYFQEANRRHLIERFYNLLPEGGMLFLGFSETLWNVFDHFKSRKIGGAFVYYKGAWPHEPHEPRGHQQRGAGRVARPRLRPGEAHAAAPARRASRSIAVPAAPHHVLSYEDICALIADGELDKAAERLGAQSLELGLATQARLRLAHAFADRGMLDRAIAEAQRTIERDPVNERAYQLLGAIYARQEQWEQAAYQLERARYLNPEDAVTLYHLAEAYRAGGRAEAAAREYRNVLRKLGDQPPDTLIDGVAVAWIRETCQRHLAGLI
jgi:chemotaxis protein methyltransferase CheR